MLNYIWLGLILISVLVAGVRDVGVSGSPAMAAVTKSVVDSAKAAVEIAIGLIGVMTLWLGLMRLAEKAGFVGLLSRLLRPLLRWLFPEIPKDHPAMGAMVMNMAANMLGLGNAATPMGIKAMGELEKLNPRPGTATNSMCTFLAINTASIQLVPATAIAILASNGSKEPTKIIVTALMASAVATTVGVSSVKIFEKLPWFRLPPQAGKEGTQ